MRPIFRATAAVAAGLFLVGGAGTLSYWTDQGQVDGVGLTTGEISMSDVTCASEWLLDGQVLAVDDQVVPGDVLTRSCSFTVTLEGDNARATLDVTDPLTFSAGSNAALVAQLTPTASYAIDGSEIPAELTPANDEQTVTADLQVTFDDLGLPADATDPLDPALNQNLTNVSGLSAALEAVTVVLTQQV